MIIFSYYRDNVNSTIASKCSALTSPLGALCSCLSCWKYNNLVYIPWKSKSMYKNPPNQGKGVFVGMRLHCFKRKND